MSNITVFNPAQVPAHLRAATPSAVAKSLAGGGGGGKRLSIKGGVFRLMVDGKQITSIDERHLDVVIVNSAAKVSRMYYPGTYDDANPAPPECWSQNGDKPDPSVKKPQAPTCAVCPQNVNGSGQGNSRACRFNQRLAVVLANDMEGDVLQLGLAATSLFGKAEGDNRPLQEYARWLIAQGVDPTHVVTRLRFDTTVQMPKLFFKPSRWLTEEELEICSEQAQSEDAIRAITLTVAQMDGVSAAPAVEPEAPVAMPTTRRAPAPAPAPTAEEPQEEPPAPPPTVRRGRKPAAATAPAADSVPEPTVRTAAAPRPNATPAATGLAQTLAAWDDE